MAFRTEDGRWRATIWVDGRRRQKRCRTKAQAERWEAEHRTAKENPGLVLGVRKGFESECVRDATTFAEFCARWLDEYCAVEKAPGQWVEDAGVIRCHLLPAFGTRRLRDLVKDDLRRLRGELAAKRKPKTVNNVVGLAKKILATAVDWDVLPASPWTSVKPLRVTRPVVAYWTPAERDAFLARAWETAPEMAGLIAVAAFTGLRRGELAGLTWQQVDFDGRLLVVDASYCFKTQRRLLRTKNGEVAVVPLNASALAALYRIRAAGRRGPGVFDVTMCDHAVQRLDRLCKRLGAKRLRFHDLRHTFGSTLAMAGVELTARQRLMRHKTVAMTDRYTHLSPDFLRAAAESIATAGSDLAPAPQPACPSTRVSTRTLEPQTGFEAVAAPRIQLVRTPA
jgi:integrase